MPRRSPLVAHDHEVVRVVGRLAGAEDRHLVRLERLGGRVVREAGEEVLVGDDGQLLSARGFALRRVRCRAGR